MSTFLERLTRPLKYLSDTLAGTHLSDMDSSWTIEDENHAIFESLSQPSGQRPALPTELIYQILDHPSRWVCGDRVSFPSSDVEESANPPVLQVRANTGDVQMKVVVSSQPLKADDIRYLRMIAFTFTSKDQGFSWDRPKHGTYDGSFSWFEAGVRHRAAVAPAKDESQLSDPQPQEYDRFKLQHNRHAGKHPEKYRIELGLDHEMVQGLKEGDVIELLALAQFGAWSNIVYCAGLELWKLDNMLMGR